MPLLTDKKLSARDVALLGVFLGYTLVISLIERMIPLGISIPGIRLGLANVAVLLALYLLPLGQVLLLVALKCLLAAIFAGSPAALLYSLGGSLLSLAVMASLLLLLPGIVSEVGVSVAGAAAHNTGQVLVACLLFESWLMLAYLPVLLLVGLATGAIIGLVTRSLRPILQGWSRL